MQNWLLPEYIQDMLPDEAWRVEQMRAQFLELLRRHGYQLVVPPLLEYAESLLIRAHFSLWAIMAAPLIAGNDLRSLNDSTLAILLNRDVIAVDQDSLGAQGTLIAQQNGLLQVWMKPLAGGSRAVALLNRSEKPAEIGTSLKRLGITAKSATVRDLWAHADRDAVTDRVRVTVPAHGVVMVKIKPA